MTARSDTGPRALWGGVGLALALLALPVPALPHAALLTAEPTQAIRLNARYDTGTPMSHALVLIHAPDAPAEIWGRGLTDAEGHFDFLPDPGLPGRWTVVVRHAGHGAMAHVEIGADAVRTVAATPQGPLQRAVMVALVAWGALGTALWWIARGRRASA